MAKLERDMDSQTAEYLLVRDTSIKQLHLPASHVYIWCKCDREKVMTNLAFSTMGDISYPTRYSL